ALGAPGTSPSGAGAGSAAAEPPRGGPSLGPQHEGHEEGVEVLAVGPVAPGADATPGGGGFCFVTGNGPYGGSAAESDVDGGRTTLTSPPLDLAAMDDPVIGYQRWYFMSSPGEPDSFLVEVSADGVAWVRARTILVSDPVWRFDEIHVKDFVSPGAAVRIRFVAQDEGTGGVVEAGVDDIAVWDAAPGSPSVPTPQPVPGAPPVLDAPRPNPTRGLTVFTLRLARPERARVEVYDLQGRKAATLYDGVAPAGALPLWWDGRGARGLRAASGVYWVRAEAAGKTLLRKIVLAR
ncbi:MAG TPA: FlgD immunoglobulin-like domain containing protein, partial [Acidobacteriota bacterium]|nr:FlgD immunoglobulin-like domain containing protein [Acidobacteriota bacterium]